ncbi:hypothetical protein CBP28_20760, partial [Fischerella thermalis WC559]
MLSRHRILNIRRLLQFLFICIFACGLCIKYFPSWSRIVSEVISVKAVVQNEYTQNFLTPPTDVNQLLKRAEKRYEAEDFQGAIADWQIALNLSNENQKVSSKIAIVEKLAKAYHQIGEFKAAIAYWEELVAYYRQTNNWPSVGQILIQQAQVYNSLGEPNDARRLSEIALQIARSHHDDTLESAALRIRGEAHRIEGNYNKAIIDLKFSIKAAQDTHNLAYQAAAFNQLGITYINLSQKNYNYAKIAWDTGEND